MGATTIKRRSGEVWRQVMREGRSATDVARALNLSQTRVERILFAIGKRRVAKQQFEASTQQLRRLAITSDV